MTDRTKQIAGFVLIIVGLLLLMLNALDYVLGWNRLGPAPIVVGVLSLAFGAGFVKRARGKEPVPEATSPKDQ